MAAFLAFGLGLVWAFPLDADTFETGGLSFSDELGGFRLLSATGKGTTSDPIVLVEEITGLNPAVIAVRRADVSSSRSPGEGVMLRSLIKIVINKSSWRWSGFDLELRGDSGRASAYSDGLSFDQLRAVSSPLHSDLFASIRTQDEPYDRLRYDQGRVEPDQAVRLAFNLIDLNPRPLFYLAQEPIVLLTEAPGAPDRHLKHYAGFAWPPNLPSHRLTKAPTSP